MHYLMGFCRKSFHDFSNCYGQKDYSNQTTSTLALLMFASSQILQFNWYNKLPLTGSVIQ